jgi:SAM-dependent methyltransferase
MVGIDERQRGSSTEFEEEWQSVLSYDRPEYLIAPSPSSGRQNDLLEWIKVQQIEQLFEEAGIQSGRLLEYGCGAAGVSLYFAEHGYEAHICDLSENALKVANLNREYNFKEVDLASSVAADVFQLPYATNSFDAVMSYGLLEHFSPEFLSRLLSETIRVLRPGGLFIADIVPGHKRYNARTLGVVANWFASSLLSISTGRWEDLARLRRGYFEHYFETTFDDQTWAAILAQHPLEGIRVDVCRPFPLLAITGTVEDFYTRIKQKSLEFHRAFDGANNWFSRQWGWMYLASGRKKSP